MSRPPGGPFQALGGGGGGGLSEPPEPPQPTGLLDHSESPPETIPAQYSKYENDLFTFCFFIQFRFIKNSLQ